MIAGMEKRTLHYIFDLIVAIPLTLVGGGYIAADLFGLIESRVFERPGLIVKEGVGIFFGTPLFLCGLWLAFRQRFRSKPDPVNPPAEPPDQSGNSN
jgi:hypothetical protein